MKNRTEIQSHGTPHTIGTADIIIRNPRPMSNIFFVETHIFSKSGRLYYFTADFLLMQHHSLTVLRKPFPLFPRFLCAYVIMDANEL